MNETRLIELGAALSRISLGIVMLAHSLYLKAMVFTLPGTAQFFTSLGLPGVAAYLVFAVEAAAGLALIAGWQVRLASVALLPVLAGATWAHWSAGWLFSNPDGGWEYPAFLTAIAAAQALLGAGALAPARSRPRGESKRPARDEAAARA